MLKYKNTHASSIAPPKPAVYPIDLSVINPKLIQELQDRVEFLIATPQQLLSAGWDLDNLPRETIMSEILSIFKFCHETEAYIKKQQELYTQQMLEAEQLAQQAKKELAEKYGISDDTISNAFNMPATQENTLEKLKKLRQQNKNNNS